MQPVPNPCTKNCPDRSPSCHGACEKYARFAAWCEHKRQERHQEAIVKQIVIDMVLRCQKRRMGTRNQQSIREGD